MDSLNRMKSYLEISYSDWLNLIQDIRTYGMNDERYDNILVSYPDNLNREWEVVLMKQVSELVTELLRGLFDRLEKGLNDSFLEADVEMADKVLRDHLKRLKHCSFFLSYHCISETHRDRLYQDICEMVKCYQREVIRFIKSIGLNDPTRFADDILYLMQKRNPYRFVCDWKTSKG